MSISTTPAPVADSPTPASTWASLRRRPTPLLVGVLILVPFVLVAMFPGVFAPHDPYAIDALPLQGPSARNPLGTDEIGRDLLSRSLYATRGDLVVSLTSALLAFSVGTVIGLFSGYVGRGIDTIVMRIVDVFLAFPTIVLALFLITIFGRGQWVQIAAIALVMTPSTARFARGEGLVLRSRGYVEASQVAGAPRRHVLFRHILPNALPTLLVAASVLAASAVMISASLSFLGLGAQPPEPSWGNMLQIAFGVVYDAPLYGLGPGVCISLVAGAYILLGEGLRRRWKTDRHQGTIGSVGGL